MASGEPQLETLRRGVSEAAVCGSVSPPSPPGDGKGSSDDDANAGAVAGGVIGGVLGGLVACSMLVAGLLHLCRQKSKARNRSNANAQTAARAASATTGQGQQMSNVPPVVVSGAVVMGQAQPSRGSLYPPTYAMGTPV